jgi:hypothetical protein
VGDTLNPPVWDVGGDDACGMLCVAVSESLCRVAELTCLDWGLQYRRCSVVQLRLWRVHNHPNRNISAPGAHTIRTKVNGETCNLPLASWSKCSCVLEVCRTVERASAPPPTVSV